MIKVSIIIPVYNVESYIERCLNSVIKQTYQGPIEAILVDDMCTDRSIKIAESFINNFNGVIVFKLLHHEKNRGLSAARNTGIDAATGDYIYFLDSDDTIEPNCLNELCKLAEKHPKVQLVQAGSKVSQGKQIYSLLNKKWLPEYSNDKKWIKKTLQCEYYLPVTAWNKLVRRDFVIENELYFKEGIIHEDLLWNAFLAKHTDCICILKKDTYNYIIRPNSITTTESIGQALDAIISIWDEEVKLIDKNCLLFSVLILWGKMCHMVLRTDNLDERHRYRLRNIINCLEVKLPWYHRIWLHFGLINPPELIFCKKKYFVYRYLMRKQYLYNSLRFFIYKIFH